MNSLLYVLSPVMVGEALSMYATHLQHPFISCKPTFNLAA